jgi:PAS domain S-box-containing protein
VIAEWQRTLTEKRSFEFVHRILRKDGTLSHVLVRARGVLDENGSLTGFIGNVQDVTRLIEAEDLNKIYKIAFDEAAIVGITDARGKIIYANEMFCRISEYGEEELLGQDHRIINSGKMGKEFSKRCGKLSHPEKNGMEKFAIARNLAGCTGWIPQSFPIKTLTVK